MESHLLSGFHQSFVDSFQMDRHTIFISHATPEDNDFTIWLASRLQLLGYKVWIDKKALLGGEKFWEEIGRVIRNESVKFLLVYSESICLHDDSNEPIPDKLKDGISKEFSYAESLSKQHNLKDFIILMNLDGADYNLFIGADRLNQIPFYENWANGLNQLVKKLKKDSIPIGGSLDSNFGAWYQSRYLISNRIESKYELYYSNWWPIKELPSAFYIYQFKTEKQARRIYESNLEFPLGKRANHLSSFQEYSSFEIEHENENLTIKPEEIFKLNMSDVLLGNDKINFPTHRDSENHLKTLLKRVFHLLMKNRGMFWYEMANKRLAYFYTPANLNTRKVSFQFEFRDRKKTKTLIGKYKGLGHWHYAVSVQPILKPVIAFSLKNHLVFTSNGFDVWLDEEGQVDKNRIQSHRRRKASESMFFNEDWRDLFLGFLEGLKKNGSIQISLTKEFTLAMDATPLNYWSSFGFVDPTDNSRHGLLTRYITEAEDDDYIIEIADD